MYAFNGPSRNALIGEVMPREKLGNAIALISQHLDYPREKLQTRYSRPAPISIGKVRADVAQRSRPQQRVADGMGQHIRIRMTEQALLERNLDSAKHKLPPLDQPVYVVAYSNAIGRSHGSLNPWIDKPSCREPIKSSFLEELRLNHLSQLQIERPSDLDVNRRAFNDRHAMTDALD